MIYPLKIPKTKPKDLSTPPRPDIVTTFLIDIIGNANDYDKTEKYLKRAKDGIKGYVKGKIYQGFADGVKKWIKQRGGKV